MAAPAPMAPAPAVPWFPGKPKVMDAETYGKWTGRIDRAEVFAKEFYPQMDRALERYSKAKYDKERYDVNALLDFAHVETKKSQLFHRTPDVQLQPIDPEDASIPWADVLPLRQKYLNHQLGPRGVNAKAALHKALLDALAASGWMVIVVGYENRMLPVPGQVGPDGQPLQIPIWERCFLSRVSPKKFLVPDDFRDTAFDEAPWLAIKGTMPLSTAKQQTGWTFPADYEGTTGGDEAIFLHGMTKAQVTDPTVEYTSVWYKAAVYDADVFHPDLYRNLVVVKGLEAPVKWCDSPDQTLDDRGRLTDDSLLGNPIHVGTLRDLPDSAYVPCDLVVGEQLSREVNKFRTSVVRGRSQRKPIVGYDSGVIDQPTADKIQKNEGPIPLPPGSLLNGGIKGIIDVALTGSEPRDNFTAQQMAERDWEKALGDSANQAGQFSNTKRTATEVRNVQGNSSARAETEKDRVRDYFVALVRKFDTLEQRYATQEKVTKVLGQQGAALWEQWKQIPGGYAYDILPDAGKYVDAQQAHAEMMAEYNMLRKDPRINVDELLKKVCRVLGYSAGSFTVPAPEPKPDPVKLGLQLNGADLLTAPLGRLAIDLLTESGLKLSPQTIAQFSDTHAQGAPVDPATGLPVAPTPTAPASMPMPTSQMHGGPPLSAPLINKHQQERTGGITGVGVQ